MDLAGTFAPSSPVPFDLTARDLVFALRACAKPTDISPHQWRYVEGVAAARDARETVVTTSVRAAFDLVLEALDLQPGDEILFTPTISAMHEIARSRGLRPVPVDLDADSLAPDLGSLERAIGPRSRVLVVAHLFGARIDSSASLRLAHRRGLVVVEDRAQAFHDVRDEGHPAADVVMHSFGVLKTSSALGGAIMCVRDPLLRARIDRVQSAWPVQSTCAYARIVVAHLALKLVATRRAHGAVVRGFETLGTDVDDLALRVVRARRGPARGSAQPDGRLRALRQRPCSALLAMLGRRLSSFTPSSIALRARAARRVAERLPGSIVHVGAAIAEHGHWVLPALAPRPDALVRSLRAAGFHASRRVVALELVASAGQSPRAEGLLSRLLYLPFFPAHDAASLDRLTTVLADHDRGD